MKKFSLIVFAAALLVGVLLAGGCGFGGINSRNSIEGSGTLKSEKRDVSGFSKIDAGGAVNLEIATGKDFGVSLETDDNLLEYVKTEVNGDTLKIYTDDGISTENGVKFKISMPEIKDLEVSGASTADVSNIKTDSLRLVASGASKVKIDGVVKNLETEASGASKIDAEGLKTENANVTASGASSSTVAPTNDLTANASGASSISYTGEPKNVVQNASGASSVKKK